MQQRKKKKKKKREREEDRDAVLLYDVALIDQTSLFYVDIYNCKQQCNNGTGMIAVAAAARVTNCLPRTRFPNAKPKYLERQNLDDRELLRLRSHTYWLVRSL